MDQIIKRAEEERKKVDEIMIQVMELRKKCNLTVDPEFVSAHFNNLLCLIKLIK